MGECKASVSLCARRASSCANFSLSCLQSLLLCDNRQLSLNQTLQLKPRERGQTPDWVPFFLLPVRPPKASMRYEDDLQRP